MIMKKNYTSYFIAGALTSSMLCGMNSQLTLQQNTSTTQQGRILLWNSPTYFTITEIEASASEMLKTMITQKFEENNQWNQEHQIIIDMSSHGYSNKSLLIFTNLMPEISSGIISSSLQKYSTQTLLDLYELSNFFIVDARPLLLKSLDLFILRW